MCYPPIQCHGCCIGSPRYSLNTCSFGIDCNHCLTCNLTWSQDGLGRHNNTPFSPWQSTCAILDRRTTRIYTRGHVHTLEDCRCHQPSSPNHYLPSHALSQPRCISTSVPGLIIPLSVCYPSHHHRVSARLRPSVHLSRADTLCSWSVSAQVGPSITLCSRPRQRQRCNTLHPYPSRGPLLHAIWQSQVLRKCKARKIARGHA